MAKLVSFRSSLDEELQDPEFAAEFHEARRRLEFALSLTLLREMRGLTQRDVEARTGIRQPMLARIEKGQIPNTPTLQKLAQALDAQIHILPDGSLRVAAAEPVPEAA